LPPLNALEAFEAAAQSESFTRAAEELRVTQNLTRETSAIRSMVCACVAPFPFPGRIDGLRLWSPYSPFQDAT
jgi:hypothetical protein